MAEQRNSDKQVVLLIDDVEICHHAIKLTFQIYCPKLELLSAFTGEEAIKILSENLQPKQDKKLIILDLSLPDMSGVDLYEYLQNKKHLKQIPVIFQSGRNITPEERGRIQKVNGGKQVVEITKPCPPQKFLSAIENILGGEFVIKPKVREPKHSSFVDMVRSSPTKNGRGR
jgi:CheY-like chemotaxis protein